MPDAPYLFSKASAMDKKTRTLSIFSCKCLKSTSSCMPLISGCGQNFAHVQLWPYQFNTSSYASALHILLSNLSCLNSTHNNHTPTQAFVLTVLHMLTATLCLWPASHRCASTHWVCVYHHHCYHSFNQSSPQCFLKVQWDCVFWEELKATSNLTPSTSRSKGIAH